MKRWHIISVLLFSYIFFMAAGIPASRALNYLKKTHPLPVTLSGVNGSIWHGHARMFTVPGQPKLENLDWTINPLALFIARVNVGFSAEIQKQAISGDVSQHLIGGDLHASNISTKLPAKSLQQLAGIPFGELGGEFEIFLDNVYLNNGMMPLIDARIFWQNARITLAQAVNIGKVTINVSHDDANQTHISIENSGGEISLNGKASLGTDRNYQLTINMKPKDATGDIAQSMKLFAQRQSDGSYLFKQSGNLRQLGY
jgi:hypothetical protein